jgi:hypothetical protein
MSNSVFTTTEANLTAVTEGLIDQSLTWEQALDSLKKSFISMLIRLAAQLLVTIPLLILFNALSGGALATTGAGTTAAAVGQAGATTSTALAGLGGASGGAIRAPSGGFSMPASASSLPPNPRLYGGSGSGGSTIVVNTMDSTSFAQFLATPSNARAMSDALRTRVGDPSFRQAVQGAAR